MIELRHLGPRRMHECGARHEAAHAVADERHVFAAIGVDALRE